MDTPDTPPTSDAATRYSDDDRAAALAHERACYDAYRAESTIFLGAYREETDG